MKNVFSEFIDLISSATFLLLRVVYTFRHSVVLILMSIVAISLSDTTEQKLCVVILMLILLWFCEFLKVILNAFSMKICKKAYKEISRRKKYTFLDANGNPSIRTEDLPEIIDILYAMEGGNRDDSE